MAALYLAAQCRALGLRPVRSDFAQEVPLTESVVDSATLWLRTGDAALRAVYPNDFIPDFGGERGLSSFAGEAVYGGSPIALSRLPELRGAVVVTEAPVPDRSLLDSLARRRAAGLVQIVPDSAAFDLYRNSRGTSRMSIAEPGIATSLLPTLPWILGAPRLARELGAGAVGRLGVQVDLQLHVSRHTVTGANVACLQPGSAAGVRDTAIVLTAHYDHLGIGPPDASGDSIYNGFSDNAAGVGMLLAVAQAMVRSSEPMRHSVILLFPTAEERGLLGSDYYVARPLWPLERTAGVINLDAGAPPAPPTSWRIAGGNRSPLGVLALDVALAHGWSATTSPATPNSDYYPFARSGVPAIFIIPGPGPYEGLTSDSSVALRKAWDHYHQPGDGWAADFPFGGLQRYAEYAYLVARALDRSDRSRNVERGRRK